MPYPGDMRMLLALLLPVLPAAASAQDVVVMRRQIAPPNRQPTPVPNPTGTALELGTWTVVARGPWAAGCSERTTRPVTAECRSASGTGLPDASCQAPRPTSEPGANLEGCRHYWSPGDWSVYSPVCSGNASRHRTLTCMRDPDGNAASDAANDVPVPDEHCAAQTAARFDGPVENTAGCTYQVDDWTLGTPSSTCSDTATRTDVAASCVRSGGDLAGSVPVSACASAGVETTRTLTNVSSLGGCTYTGTYQWGQCVDGSQTSTALLGCRRNPDGKEVQGSFCPATATQPCTTPSVCGPLVGNQWYATGATPTVQVNLGSITGKSAALEVCNSYLANNPGKKGACVWDANGAAKHERGPAYFMEHAVTSPMTRSGFEGLYSSACR